MVYGLVENDIKDSLKKLAKEAEVKLTESVLRWKHNKEGKKMPDKKSLEHRSRLIADQANKVIAGRGKSILDEIRKAYRKGRKQEDRND